MKAPESTILNILGKIPLVMVWLGAVSVLAMAALLCYDVGMRYFFNAPKSWAIEIAQYLMLATFFLPLAYVQQKERHIRVDLFLSRIPPRFRKALDGVLLPILTLAVSGTLLWQVGKLSLKFLRRGTVSATSLRIPFFPLSLILVAAFVALIVMAVIQFWKRESKAARHD